MDTASLLIAILALVLIGLVVGIWRRDRARSSRPAAAMAGPDSDGGASLEGHHDAHHGSHHHEAGGDDHSPGDSDGGHP